MKMSRWVMLLSAILLMASTGVFASGQKESKEKIVLKYYQWFNQDLRGQLIAKNVEEFQKLHPNIVIEPSAMTNEAYWDRLTLDIASNSEGDIITLDTGAGMSGYHMQRPGGAFLALDDYIKGYVLPDGTSLEKDIMFLDQMKRNGKTIALPFISYVFQETAFRKSALQKANVKPEDLSTWEGFKTAVAKLTVKDDKGKVVQYGFGFPSHGEVLSRWWLMNWLWTAGGGIFPNEQPPYTADRLIFNSKENVFALQYLKDLLENYCPPGEKSALELLAMFNKGSVATFQIALWTLGNLENDMEPVGSYNTDLDYVAFPTARVDGQNKDPVYVSWGNPVAVSSRSKHPKEAFEFVAFLHSEEAQKRESVVAAPTNRRVMPYYEQKFPHQAKFIKICADGKFRNVPDIPQWNQFDHIVQEAAKSALLGVKTPKEALDWGQEEMAKILK
jgi:multiple sugar transport system substrate-binding protein